MNNANLGEAKRFLHALDPKAKSFTFQVFDDDKSRKDKHLAHIFHGGLDKHAASLEIYNGKGAGVFVTVNETNGKGRKLSNMVRPRVIFQECDSAENYKFPLEPHLEVETSPGKFHRYWLIEPATAPDWDDWSAVMEQLVKNYGSDPNAKDITRVLRLPGFFHMKNPEAPFMVHIVHLGEHPAFTWQEIAEAFPPIAKEKPQQAALPPGAGVEVEKVGSALAHLDPNMAYESWLKVGAAIHHGDGGGPEGLRLWSDWSAKGAKYKEDEPEAKWLTFNRLEGPVVTLDTLYFMAREEGWSGVTDADMEELSVPDADSEELALPKEAHKRPFQLISARDLTATPYFTDWLLKGFIEKGSLNLLFGEPGAGKSLFALEWAWCIATGSEWNGHRTKAADVVIVAGEGYAGMARRLRALEIKYGEQAPERLFISKQAADFLDPKSAGRVAAAVKAACPNPGLVIVDTLHRNMAGDENSSQDIGIFIQNLDLILKGLGAAVLVVHHSGHGEKTRSRGSSSIRAAMDSEFSATKDDAGVIALACHKSKDFEASRPLQFGLKPVPIGWFDEDGEMTSVYLDFQGEARDLKPALSPREAMALEKLTETIEACGFTPLIPPDSQVCKVCRLDDWREAVYPHLEGETSAKKVAFQRVRKKLLEAGLVREKEGQWWLVPPVDIGDIGDIRINDSIFTKEEGDLAVAA